MSMPPRYELKYWCSHERAQELLHELHGELEPDPHSDPNYTVTSLYFDTPDYEYFLERIEGIKNRVKFRLRRYDDTREGFAELKGRKGRRILKRRLPLSADDLAAVARGGLAPLEAAAEEQRSLTAVLMLHEFVAREIAPSVITRYERAAYFLHTDPLVRVTLDTALVGWGEDLAETFLAGDAATRLMVPPASEAPAILEVKVSGPIPAVIARALRRVGLVRTNISKYCLAVERCRDLPPELRRAVASWSGTA